MLDGTADYASSPKTKGGRVSRESTVLPEVAYLRNRISSLGVKSLTMKNSAEGTGFNKQEDDNEMNSPLLRNSVLIPLQLSSVHR